MVLGAGNNVDIMAATNTNSSWRFKETRKSGLMGTGGIGFTIGSSKTTHELREQGTIQAKVSAPSVRRLATSALQRVNRHTSAAQT
ncbi:hypothetical protein GL503_08850 [Salmonella enterica]|nr:hypothetical protein [Salmonella enterica subsp. enterica serovar Dahomey]EEB7407206.1 hypothetical protein [Salmonella enterica]